MLKILVNKQLTEIFRGYFYNPKTKKARSKAGIIGYLLLFLLLMFGCLGSVFAFLANTLCQTLCESGLSWMYFSVMGGISLLLGVFGSVFNTYSGLYLSKDNDLLLSMPISVNTVMLSRLIGVYIMGTMYSSMVLLPTLIVYFIRVKQTALSVLSCILMFLAVTVFILVLSCALGFIVAKISLKLKNKSFITVLISVLFIGGYYFAYYKANMLINEFLQNAKEYSAIIQGKIYPLYLLGAAFAGKWSALVIALLLTAALFAGTWLLLNKTFLKITTSTGRQERHKEEKAVKKQNSIFFALLKKEFLYLKSSANYMLNCALGVLLIPAAGIAMLLKGDVLLKQYEAVLPGGGIAVLAVCALCALSFMCDTGAPSVSLEGRSLWILQSMPIRPFDIIKAKISLQLILTLIPTLTAYILLCAAGFFSGLQYIAAPLLLISYQVLFAGICMVVGIKKPLLAWDSEIIPIKQNFNVFFAMLGGALLAVLPAVIHLILPKLEQSLLLFTAAVLYAAGSVIVYRWLKTEGARRFAALTP